MYTLEEKIALIEESNSFLDLNKEIMPKAHKEDYYFVSYSHKDYKKVMKDILLLEDQGVNIWYDSDMHIGENWEDIAEMYISKFQCKGIIFYLSENSILSKACNKEVEYVLENGKQFFSINIPLEGSQNAVSGLQALLTLKDMGHNVSDRLIENFKKAFSDKTLYLSYGDSIQRKKEQIEKLVGEDSLLFTSEYNLNCYEDGAKLLESRENSIIRMNFKNNYQINDENSKEFGRLLPLMSIDNCVFANHYKLQEVTLPEKVDEIGDYAFVNCFNLKKINLDIPLHRISDFAFRSCKSLTVDFVNCLFIKKYAFYECDSLDEITLKCNSIGNFALANCKSLKTVNFVKEPIEIGAYCFSHSKNLSKINFLNNEPNVICTKEKKLALLDNCFADTAFTEITLKGKIDLKSASGLFEDCKNLKKVSFEIKNLKTLKSYAFTRCDNLEEVSGLDSVKVYENNCFYACFNLTKLNLKNATKIQEQAFAGVGFEELILPNVTHIGTYAFQGMQNLKKIVIGEKLEEIDDRVFYNSNGVKELEVYATDFYFDEFAFATLEPEVITVCNLDLLYNLAENCGDQLKTIYLLKGIANEEDLLSLPFELILKESDKEGFDCFTVGNTNPYSIYKDERVGITLTNGETIYTFCDDAGFDEEKGEYYVIAGKKYYQSQIQTIFKLYSL